MFYPHQVTVTPNRRMAIQRRKKDFELIIRGDS